MRTLATGLLAAATSIALVGCDPYANEDTSPPVVVGAIANADGHAYDAPAPTTGTAWSIGGIATVCAAPAVTAVTPFIFVQASKLLDGRSIQASTADCTPAGNWLAVSGPALPGASSWYACYSPGSPRSEQGGSVVIYRGPSGGSAGWTDAEDLDASATVVTTYRFTGTVKDKQGNSLPVDVTATLNPNPGVPGDPTYTYGAGPAVTIAWSAADCGGAATYAIERAPNAPAGTPPDDAPGTWAALAGAGAVAGLTYTDSTVTAGTKYWYRVTGKTAVGGFTGDTSGETMATVP